MHHRSPALVVTLLALAGCTAAPPTRPAPRAASAGVATSPDVATGQVIATERAFARTMAERDFKAFSTFLSSEAVFFSGNQVMHGAAEVATQWLPYFKGPAAPFEWRPDHVEVLPSGRLALSTGPVIVAGRVSGRFNSIWRLEGPNTWRIVFDKGEAVCSAPPDGPTDFSQLKP